MADVRPSLEKGHLVVAAIRICREQASTPPGPKEIAQLLSWGNEETLVVLHGLVKAEILTIHESPFEAYYEIKDHLKLEDLPREAEQEALEDEVEEFKRSSKSKQDELERIFDEGDREKAKKKQLENLEDEFFKFKDQSNRFPG
jgi:hypothetical protein